MEIKKPKKTQKINSVFYTCEKCAFVTSHKNDYARHLLTLKHNGNDGNQKNPKNPTQKTQKTQNLLFTCNCGKQYKTYSGLWKHNHVCTFTPQNVENEIEIDPNIAISNKPCTEKCVSNELVVTQNDIVDIDTNIQSQVLSTAIMELIKQNNELRNIIMEQNKQNKENVELTTQAMCDVSKHITTEIINAVKMGGLGVVNNTMTNSHNNNNNNNNSFNLNLFLNETCKNAMNIDEFIQKIKISDEDLEETARLGYSGGITRIFIKELNSLDITQKPIHCSDAKRETVYIKDNDKWEKDDDDKSKLTLAVKKTAHKNFIQLFEWEKTHPMCKKDPDSVSGKLYNKIILHSMSGGTIEEQFQNINKVVKNIIKHTIIDKTTLVVI